MSSYVDILQKTRTCGFERQPTLGLSSATAGSNKPGMNQRSLAQKVGGSRQWIVEVEKGKPRAETGLLLGTIDALGIPLITEIEIPGKPRDVSAIDIDSIVATARGKGK